MVDTEHTVVERQSNWRDNKSMSGCLVYLSQNKLWHDISFSFKNNGGKLLHAHRFILRLRSHVFEKMCFDLLAENRDTVNIEDVEYDIFDHMLRYIYTDKTNLNGDNVLPILYGAKKYCLTGLVNVCSSFLQSSLSCDNVCTIYEHAKMYNMKALMHTCFDFITKHSDAVSLSENSTCLSRESLVEFLSCKDISGAELNYFRLANKWADEQCKSQDIEPTPGNKRSVLGDIVTTKVNYTMMTPEEFSEVVVPTNILLAEDQIKLFQYMITGNKKHIEQYQFPSRNISFRIDTSRFEGLASETDQFMFTFCCSRNVTLMKLCPITLRDCNELGRQNVAKVIVNTENSIFDTNVPITKLDESGSITHGLDKVFRANIKYTVRIILQNYRDPFGYKKRKPASIRTLKPFHTTKVGSVSCTILQIPECVKTVEFKVEN